MIAPRRAFLRGLASLPLIGGSVALIGQPTAAAMPITLQLAEAYLGWLRLEQCKLMHEIVDGPCIQFGSSWQSHSPSTALPRSPDLVSVVAAGPASARAAVMMSAAGIDILAADTSACSGLAERGCGAFDTRYDPFGPDLDDEKAFEAYRRRTLSKTGPLLL